MLAVLTVAIVFLPAALPLSQVFATNCPASGSDVTANLTLNSDCSYTSENGFILAASGITVDCAQHTISFTGTQDGHFAIKVGYGYVDDTVKNCLLTGSWEYGFYVIATSGLTLMGNSVTGAYYGYYIEYVSNIVLTGNTATSDTYGFDLNYAFNVLLKGNTATDSTANGFNLANGSGGALTGNAATGSTNGNGFYLYETQYTLTGNSADSNKYYGYVDHSVGPGTIGLGNTYIKNECQLNGDWGSEEEWPITLAPAFLCTPQG